LAISKRLAEAMGGTMWVQSAGEGHESTFLRLDCGGDRARRRDTARCRPASRLPEKLALRLLSRMGYTADVAADGREAVEAVAHGAYDLVLMDVQMPEMDGLEATSRIVEATDPAARPRILAMTANAMDGDRERCLAAGMDGYISKPIRVAGLVGALLASPSADAIGRPGP
jgi:CheY-like chemotaxis protein